MSKLGRSIVLRVVPASKLSEVLYMADSLNVSVMWCKFTYVPDAYRSLEWL